MKPRTTLLLLLVLVSLIGASGQVLAKAKITKGTYNALAKVHKLIEGGRYDEATTRIGAIGTTKASAYERALVLQTHGYLHARKRQYQDAITALKGCLALKALPRSATRDARYLLIQMQAATGGYAEAAKGMDAWLASKKRPSAQAHALAGSMYAKVKRLDEAANRFRKAIDRSKEPQESWFRRLAAVYLETERYEAAAALLGDMVSRFPQRKQYWMQLSGTHQALGDDAKALAVMELAYRRGLSFDEGELLKLASFQVYMGQPYRAGDLLAKALATSAVRPSVETWQLLSNAWAQARETRPALKALERALEIAPSADLHLRRAQLAADIEDWGVASEAAQAALATGGLEQPSAAHLLLGIAQYHLDRQTEALEAFEQALEFETSSAQAEQWMDFLSGGVAALGDETEKELASTLDLADG